MKVPTSLVPAGSGLVCEISTLLTNVEERGDDIMPITVGMMRFACSVGDTPVVVVDGQSPYSTMEGDPEETPERRAIVDQLIAKLQHDGWVAAGQGDAWFAYRFRRT